MKIHVIKRGAHEKDLKLHSCFNAPLAVVYCGYLELENPFKEDLWDWCNWSCWTSEKPKVCEHLLLTHCNSDVSFCINGDWYSHGMHKFSSFEECYKEMTKFDLDGYFLAVYPHFEGLWKQKIQFVTPENINDFITE